MIIIIDINLILDTAYRMTCGTVSSAVDLIELNSPSYE